VCVHSCACSDASEIVVHSADAFAPVAYLRLTKLQLERGKMGRIQVRLLESKVQ